MSKPSPRTPGVARRRMSDHNDPDPCPRLLGNWQLDSAASCGMLTDLYYARPVGCPPDWPSDYVVKVLKAPHDSDPLAINFIRREAEIGRQISNSHIVPILESRVNEAPYWVVMPRLSGAALNRAVAAIGYISVPQALWITRQIAAALKSLHKCGWIHADVKPSNIIVSADGHATLIDFGSSLKSDESLISWDRPVVGTLHYIAPEMLTSQTAADCRSDIYSLGVTLFEMLSGRLPFQFSDQAELIQAHLSKTPPDLRQLRNDIPRFVADLVTQMLEKDPMKRPQTAKELIGRLMDLEIETLDIRVAA